MTTITTPQYTLYNGDCRTFMRGMEAGSVDAVVTDLPYGTTACKWDNVIPFSEMWEVIKHVLKPKGVFLTTASQPFTSALVMSNPSMFKHEWIWLKSHSSNFQSSKHAPLKNHESVIVFGVGGTTYNPQMESGIPVKKRVGAVTSKVSKFGSIGAPKIRENAISREYFPMTPIYFDCGSRNESEHPTQKPVALFDYLIRTYTNPGETVMDICMGSGTTGVAALQLGRRFIGCELDAGYFAIAQRRIENAAAQPLLLPPQLEKAEQLG